MSVTFESIILQSEPGEENGESSSRLSTKQDAEKDRRSESILANECSCDDKKDEESKDPGAHVSQTETGELNSASEEETKHDEDALQDALIQAAEDAMRFVYSEADKNVSECILNSIVQHQIEELNLHQKHCLRRLDDMEYETIQATSKLEQIERFLAEEERRRAMCLNELTAQMIMRFHTLNQNVDLILQKLSLEAIDTSEVSSESTISPLFLRIRELVQWDEVADFARKCMRWAKFIRRHIQHQLQHAVPRRTRFWLGFLLVWIGGFMSRRIATKPALSRQNPSRLIMYDRAL